MKYLLVGILAFSVFYSEAKGIEIQILKDRETLNHLRSYDGTRILLSYRYSKILDRGKFVHYIADKVSVDVSFSEHISQQLGSSGMALLVFVNSCQVDMGLWISQTYVCPLIKNSVQKMHSTKVTNRVCRVKYESEIFKEFDSSFLSAHRHISGESINCKQELAIQYGVNNWVVNPVGSSNNFENHNFQFKFH